MCIYCISAYCCTVTSHITLKFAAITGKKKGKKNSWENKPFVFVFIRTALNSYEYV